MSTTTTPDQSSRPAISVTSTEIVLPGNTNTHGTMFGGDVLALMDKTAAIAAIRFCRQPVVTASTERIDFRTPIRLGDIIEARARVIYTGRTSMIVKIDIDAEQPLTGEQRRCTTGYYSFVSIDEHGKPQSVPPLDVRTDDERRDWERGAEIHQQIRERHKTDRADATNG